MTLATVPAARTGPETRSGYPPTESRPRWIALGHSPQPPTRLTACSRPTPLPRSPAPPPCTATDQIFRRTPLVSYAFPASAGLPAGLPLMAMS